MAKSADYQSIRTDIEHGIFAPIYILHGDESFFIDQLTDLLLDKVLTDEEKDFNLTQMYGADILNLGDVVTTCRRYPMMAERQLVLLREVQALDQRKSLTSLDVLEAYTSHPLVSTVFVITCKSKKLDARQRWLKQAAENGAVIFESKRMRDYEFVKFLPGFLKTTGLSFDEKAIQMINDYIGADLSRMMAEIDKLRLNLKDGNTKVTAEMIANHIGVSKDFNSFELVSAVAQRDFRKCEIIRRYFAQNPKSNPIQVTMSVLFNFFSNVMLSHYAQDKSLNGLMREVGLNFPQAKEMTSAMKIYSATKAMNNIAIIREFDARQKGARGANLPDDEALQELLYRLMH
ncbi:MAG: DNA polymerase III subunit delta [Bacteroidales bacterium]|nr:DNA polymerase III subunit delta [Candidatus Liminaster caballi]